MVATWDEVESLVLHLVPAQVTTSGSRDWGGPVFGSPMLKSVLGYLWCTGCLPFWGCFAARVILASGLLPALHSLDILKGLTRAISPGMIFGDRFALSGEKNRANGVACRYWARQFVLSGEMNCANGVTCRYWARQFALSGERNRAIIWLLTTRSEVQPLLLAPIVSTCLVPRSRTGKGLHLVPGTSNAVKKSGLGWPSL
ncbi:hypothetical protein ACLB2K_040476 [Fragaria x ananassa]